MTEIEVQQIGRVDRVIQPPSSKPYGFIVTSDGKRFFFHQVDCKGKKMPERFALVRFFAVKEKGEGKNDRALCVQIVDEPAPA